MIRKRSNISSYVTKDGSTIWELFHQESSPVAGFSVAEALVGPGKSTKPHKHLRTQEVYYILEGGGEMRLGAEVINASKGDAILIPPGTTHMIKNTGPEGLRVLCICSPPYSHEDTELER
jgi:mannose-6-phosphate isomerase-like protein (cupin superfamily)